MSLNEIKKSPLVSLPYLKKRLRRITALGLRNLTVNEFNFTVHFTLHRNEKTVAFYTSESLENQRSPEWSYLKFPTGVQFLQDFLIRVWITSSNNCRLFLEYDVHLDDSLVPDEQKDDSHINNDSLWLEMFGYRFIDNESMLNNQKNVQIIDIKPPITEKKSKRNYTIKSYNKLSILRMINFADGIRTLNRLSAQYLQRLQTFFDSKKDYLSKIKERESRHLRIENFKQHLLTQIIIYERRLNSNQKRQQTVTERKNLLEQNLLQLLNQQEDLHSQINHLNESKCLLHDLIQLTTFRQKDIISEIYHYVYPIISENKNEYSIANIKLPPAEDKSYQALTREREYEVEAAVGYCAHIVLIISQFIQLPLRFPIEYHSASSIKIYDYSVQVNEFPLYPSYDSGSFHYGLFLLNRNIGQIMYHCRVGGRHADYRKTLENLKELMKEYFINTNNRNSIQLYALNQQSIDSTILSNNSSGNTSINNERVSMRNKRNSNVNSVFSPSRSATSSFIETNEDEQNEDDNDDDVDLFPTLNTISPRLTMQFSQQQQQQ